MHFVRRVLENKYLLRNNRPTENSLLTTMFNYCYLPTNISNNYRYINIEILTCLNQLEHDMSVIEF